jgi:CO/xanthine dehydrogenase Mo-binding subunit
VHANVAFRHQAHAAAGPTWVGTAAAIASTVYHATGKCIRQLPIRIENLISA